LPRRRGRPFRRLRSARLWVQRFAFLLLICAALALIVIDRTQSPWARTARAFVTDMVTPMIVAVSEPVQAVSDWFRAFESSATTRERNASLTAEVARLRLELQKKAGLAAENKRLRALLNAGKRYVGKHIAARVLTDPGGVYVRSVIIDAGRLRGVRRGLAVIAPEGMVGRVVEVGERSARVMLITDLNSRLPVKIEATGERAVVAGTNGRLLKLIYLAHALNVKVGTKIVTSGQGGVLPPGIEVGQVVEVKRGTVLVQPNIPWNRLTHVRVIDYATPGLVVQGTERGPRMDRPPVEQPSRAERR
jgi:rod shape-determining protein MreC